MNSQISNITELVIYALERKAGVPQTNILLKLEHVSDTIIRKIKDETGIELMEYRFVMTSSSINHSLNNHANPKIEAKRNPPQIAIHEDDFLLIPQIFSNPDKIVKAEKVGDTQRIKFYKSIENKRYVAVAEIRTGRQSICLVTLYVIENKTPI